MKTNCTSVVPVAPLISADVVVGAPVAAIGSPFGNQSSLAVGVVSATGRSIPSLTSRYAVADAIQTDAPINRGNSGGPMLDARGRVIGINAQIRSNSGTAEGVGFAIPINVARRSLEQLVTTGRVVYAYIGITTQDVTPGLSKHFRLGAPRGALVAEVEPDTPAAKAGIKGGTRRESYNGEDLTLGGDLVVSIGDTPVRSSEDVSRIVSEELLPGQRVTFTIVREGTSRTVPVVLGERPLHKGVLLIGRADRQALITPDVKLFDPANTVSRGCHAWLHVYTDPGTGAEFNTFVIHNQSPSGILVNGRLVMESAALGDEAEIKIGIFRMRVVKETPAPRVEF